jgi:hypothetical protein
VPRRDRGKDVSNFAPRQFTQKMIQHKKYFEHCEVISPNHTTVSEKEQLGSAVRSECALCLSRRPEFVGILERGVI